MEENRDWLEETAEGTAEPAAPAADEAARAEAPEMTGLLEALKGEMERQVRGALDEALRLNGMSPEARAEYEARAREDDLTAREQALLRRELRSDARELLAEKGLPASLAEAVACENRPGMESAVRALEGAFRQAVQAEVEARLRGVAPAAGAAAMEAGDDMDDETYYAMQRMLRG